MNQRVQLEGRSFGRLTVIEYLGARRYLCMCSCGNEHIVGAQMLTGGNVTSCGCYRVEATSKRMFKHGAEDTATYKTWIHMRRRCNDPKCDKYPWYGGKGVTICERWDDYLNFLADMGERPAGMTIDRIDPHGNYEPSNCRWSDTTHQARNKVNSLMFEGKHLKDWAEELGVKYHTLYARLKKKGTIHGDRTNYRRDKSIHSRTDRK